MSAPRVLRNRRLQRLLSSDGNARLTVLLLIASSLPIASAACGSGVPANADPAPVPAESDRLKRCPADKESAGFAHYDLGREFEGLPLVARDRTCVESTASEPSGTRQNVVSYVYGTCDPGAIGRCAPPLEVQTWPLCERNPSKYGLGPAEVVGVDQTLPHEKVSVRGTQARLFGTERLELYTDDATVVIFGDPNPQLSSTSAGIGKARAQLLRAAAALRKATSSPRGVGLGEPLPAPRSGAVSGSLPC